MNRRLNMLYHLLPQSSRGIIDVGTDHAWIPIQLARKGYSGSIFASDIAEEPLNKGKMAASKHGVGNNIRFICCDGLSLCPPQEIDTILIAGMGGDTICGILDRTEWLFSGEYRLILQPMSRADILRYWIVHNEFVIDCEAVVKENEHIYQIICACPGKSERYSDSEYLTGKQDILHVGDEQQILLLSEWNRMKKILNGLSESGKTDSSEFLFFNRIRMEIEESLTA